MDVREAPAVPEERREPLTRVLRALLGARHVVLTTHVNADGDGAGCEAAIGGWLAQRGVAATIVNPTAFPDMFRYLVEDPVRIADPADGVAMEALQDADLFLVLDTSEPRRLGRVAKAFHGRPVLVIDHHPPSDTGIAGGGLQDPGACATGELVYDLLRLAGPDGEPWPPRVVEALYVAIVTDTGSFRFANTTPRTHRIAADLMARGIDPEAVYRRIFGSVPLRRIRLLQAALERLAVDPDLPMTWVTIPGSVAEELAITSEDLDGIIEHARSLEGTEVALLFRETADGATKVSFRSNGALDVNALAREFGGGGHVKAAGALIGGPLEPTRAAVLEATREALRVLEQDRESS